MPLSGKQKRYLRGLAHERKSVITVGSGGLSESVLKELALALEHHELIKVKLPAVPKAQREELMHSICETTGAELVQIIGRSGVIYRAAADPGISLPG